MFVVRGFVVGCRGDVDSTVISAFFFSFSSYCYTECFEEVVLGLHRGSLPLTCGAKRRI